MVRSFSILALCSAIALSSACAGKKPRPASAIYFSTSITQDGGKFFVYSLETPEKELRDGRKPPTQGMKGDRPGRGEGPGPGVRAEPGGRSKDALKRRVDSLIAQNRYCRDGYVVLEQYTVTGLASLRGECREGATPEDRIRFRNPV